MRNATAIRTVMVAGAGTMGTSIAQIFAQSGFDVILYNRRQPSLDRAKTRISGNLDTAIQEGTAAPEEKEIVFSRLSFTTDLNDFAKADYIVEGIAEDLAVKHAFFHAISEIIADDVVVTSNTSGLPITSIAAAVKTPSRFAGMHFWNPPHLVPLVEIIKGDETADEAAQIVFDITNRIEKKPVIVKKDIKGQIGNRLQLAIVREALHILETGAADVEDIDAVMKYSLGFRYACLGPFESLDLGGLDIFDSISSYLFPDLSKAETSGEIGRLVEQGNLGVKSGRGFYNYAGDRAQRVIEERDANFMKLRQCLHDKK
ncbi:MAG: 3-hydroxyacyl-CoA dehydrogenase family protein [Oscillospiraceae bacterium]|jgi:3-hydroxybutyryl-CoA dehydrogenase